MPGVAALMLLGPTSAPRGVVPADAPSVEALVGTGLLNRALCAGCVALFVGLATELTPLGVLAVANSAPWAAAGCALQCAIATM